MLGNWVLRTFILFVCFIVTHCDEGYYVDTNAAFIGDQNLDLRHPPTIFCQIGTSSLYLADTSDSLYITFVGSFSSSGPHQIGPFLIGSVKSYSIQLDRVIGDLLSATFQTSGSDGWLLSTLSCRILSTWYDFATSSIWLESLDPNLATDSTITNIYGDQLQNLQGSVVASSNYQIYVSNTYNDYNAVGLASS